MNKKQKALLDTDGFYQRSTSIIDLEYLDVQPISKDLSEESEEEDSFYNSLDKKLATDFKVTQPTIENMIDQSITGIIDKLVKTYFVKVRKSEQLAKEIKTLLVPEVVLT
ncbi:hypothetical protein BB558_002804, partial [Smittium angustum]